MDFKTPGAYVQEVTSLPASVAQVETAIPAFIGFTEKKAGSEEPVRITSMLEYIENFGGSRSLDITVTKDGTENVLALAKQEYKMYYAMQMFFNNGGGPCYIVSVGGYEDDFTQEAFEAGLTALLIEDEPTLIVMPELVNLNDDAKIYSVYKSALDQAEKLQDRFVIIDTTSDEGLRDNLSSGTSLKYGAAYYPNLITTLSYAYDEASVSVETEVTTIVSEEVPAVPAEYDDDGNLVTPGTPAIPAVTETNIVTKTLAELNTEATSAEYNEVKAAVEAKLATEQLILGPSSAIAGVYAKVDGTQGVWKSPANVGLNYIAAPEVKLSNEDQESYNVDANGKSINVIRSFTGKGNIVWGARTLDGNSGEWKYISVRRFFNMVEESVKNATEAFIFEPNTANTWVRVRGTIENFLNLQWRNGALAGATPEDAFYVRVGLGQTMTSQDVLDGIMNIEIGMATVRPAEFIVLKFSHKLQEA